MSFPAPLSRLAGPNLGPLPLFVVALAGCAEPTLDRSAALRDSSGVIIVENAAQLWDEESAWQLPPQPQVSIGVSDGDPQYQLYRVSSCLRLDDGSVILANTGTQELRWYAADGAHLRTVGGQGGGPSEFRNLDHIIQYGTDSIIAFDPRNRSLSVFDRHGVLSRSAVLERPHGDLQGAFSDGSLLMTESNIRERLRYQLRSGDDMEEGTLRFMDSAFRITSNGEVIDSLGSFAGAEGTLQLRTSGEVVAAAFQQLPFGRTAVFAVAPAGYYTSSQDSYEVSYFDSDGVLSASVRRTRPNRSVTAADIARYQETTLADIVDETERRDRLQQLRGLPYPESMPAHGDIVVDADGNLWVEEYLPLGEADPKWSVFDNSHRLLGSVDLPPDFTVHQIGSDFVLGVWQDEFDVEQVRLYELIKP
jgi:hypothetical protein